MEAIAPAGSLMYWSQRDNGWWWSDQLLGALLGPSERR